MNRQVVRYGEENRIGSMGTTTAFVAFSRDGVYVGNLGDSRVYCSEKDRLQQVSVDHVIGRSFLETAFDTVSWNYGRRNGIGTMYYKASVCGGRPLSSLF